eukprot:gene1812-4912_t
MATTAKRTQRTDVVISASKRARWYPLASETKDFALHSFRQAVAEVTSAMRSVKAREEIQHLSFNLERLVEERLVNVDAPKTARVSLMNMEKTLLLSESLLTEASNRLDELKKVYAKNRDDIEDVRNTHQSLGAAIKPFQQFHKKLHKQKLHKALQHISTSSRDGGSDANDSDFGHLWSLDQPDSDQSNRLHSVAIARPSLKTAATLQDFLSDIGCIQSFLRTSNNIFALLDV